MFKNADDYLLGANYVIRNGIYTKEMNGYLRFIGVNGGANYAFVGLDQSKRIITTFGIRKVEHLVSKVPWLKL